MTTIKQRRGTAAQWVTANPVLAVGEPGHETDTHKKKTGDGTTAWNSLAYDFSATYRAAFIAPAPSGDATGVTDRTALLALLTQAEAHGGAVVLQAAGQANPYIVDQTLAVASPAALVSASESPFGAAIKQAAGMTTDLVTQSGEYSVVENLSLIGNGGAGRALVATNCFIGSRTLNVNATGFGATAGTITFASCDRMDVDGIWAVTNGGQGVRFTSCTRMRLGQVASEHSPATNNAEAMAFVRCDEFSARVLTVEQTTAATIGSVGVHFDSCIGYSVDTIYANGTGSGGQADAVKVSNTTTPGRTGRFVLLNVSSDNYTNHVNDVVNAFAVTAAATPGGLCGYSDGLLAIPGVGGIYSGGAHSPMLAPDAPGTVYIRPNGFGAGAAQSTFGTGRATIGTDMEVNGAFGCNSNAPVGKAANPGVAAGTDAAVINAVITALRNVGIVT